MQVLSIDRRTTYLLLVVISTLGCTPEANRYIRFPRLFGPGTAPHQRAEAIQHDPYPLSDVGPPVEGGRPREYQQPVPEVDRARMATQPPVHLPPVGVPTYVAPPALVAPPSSTTPFVPPQPTSPYQVQPRSPY